MAGGKHLQGNNGGGRALSVICGVEEFCANLDKYVGKKRLGLITNPSGVDRNLTSTVDRLYATGQLSALFGPEHGVRGVMQAGEKVDSYHDPKTNLPVYSLYGETRRPTPEMLSGIEAIVFDIQDVGCRFYTYIYTLLYAMEAAAEHGIQMVVLDRPNPLGGRVVEGNILEPEFTSFVGYPIPVRYGLTIGELARYFNTVYDIKAELTVVPIQGWQRHLYGDELGLPWVPPSPNIPKMETALIYAGTCFVEGTNLSEGRGTALPFEVVGAPFINSEELAAALNGLKLPGAQFRPTAFTPTFSKNVGELCQGVQIHVVDRNTFRPVETGLLVVAEIARLYPEFQFLIPQEQGRHYFFDLLAGTDQVRKIIEDGKPLTDLFAQWEREQREFRRQCEPFLLY